MMMVLLSGGLDSTVALFWARERWPNVSAMSVDYKQKHRRRELKAAAHVASLAGVPHAVKRLEYPWPVMNGPVVLGRNSILLMIAASHAASKCGGACGVVIGACAADAAVFVDCRPEYLLVKQQELSLGLGVEVTLVAPWVDRTKAQIVAEARRLNAWEAVAASWSCYEGEDVPCGECGACLYRAEGFAQAGEVDPWK